jgi:aspartoacylase
MNSGESPSLNSEVEVYKHVKTVEFPVDERGDIKAFIHKEIQDKDYQPIQNGQPIFETLEGEIIRFKDDGVFYPVFINEAAYYYKNIAFSLTEKVIVNHEHGLTNKE